MRVEDDIIDGAQELVLPDWLDGPIDGGQAARRSVVGVGATAAGTVVDGAIAAGDAAVDGLVDARASVVDGLEDLAEWRPWH